MKRFGMTFTKIEFPDCDLYLPFDCRMCGNCCRCYIPFFPERHLLEISIYYGISEDDVLREHGDCMRLHIRGKPARCLFLRGSTCMIYDHPLRPETCSRFPFSYQYGKVKDCPGYDMHLSILEEITRGERDFAFYDSSFCPVKPFRAPSDSRKNSFWERFLLFNPAPQLVRKYLILNEFSTPAKIPCLLR